MTVDRLAWGYRWRSSPLFVRTTATLSLFSETFLFGFVVPILPYMLETRLHVNPARTQTVTTALLTIYGVVSLISTPIFAHFFDKIPSRKIPLLLSLTACTSGTVLVAWAPTLWVFLTGQILQSVASASVWVVAFATLADNVTGENKGKVMGTAMSVVMTGVFAGPMLSGTLLRLLGYWAAWSGALFLLALDILFRLLMIDTRSASVKTTAATPTEPDSESDEHTGLLRDTNSSHSDSDQDSNNPSFYRIMLTTPQVLAALINTLALTLLLCAFDTTLPLHVRDAFNWDSLPVGLIFLALQAPSVLLGPVVGLLRDRVGLRYPTTFGWAILAPLLVTLGIDDKTIYIVSIVGIGFALAFIRGAGAFQMMSIIHTLESQNQHLFGPYGGNSRLSALTEVPYTMGMILGPLVAGSVTETVGYFWLNCLLSGISVLVAGMTATFLTAGAGGMEMERNLERDG
ncbi:major facilitator superfamily domain-containing protein [Aspergillus egyptiacus]|nr:major facilitator superfamily domain-containing protein [Aspergillus egyptiacus]